MARFRLFKNGMLLGTVEKYGSSLICARKNLAGDGWAEVTPAILDPEFPIEQLFRNWEEYEKIPGENAQEAKGPDGTVYKKYRENTDDQGRKVWIWVQRGKDNPLDLIFLDAFLIGAIQTDRQGQKILIREGYENLTPLSWWKDESLSKSGYGIESMGVEKVKTRDGIELGTKVWLPVQREEKVPAVLIRTPYGWRERSRPFLHLTDRGYALVVQDVRGREDSGGEWKPFVNEKEDGEDTLNWIASQPWSNGRVGMIGNSYDAFVQWAAATTGHPALQAVISRVTSGTPFVDIPRRGGTLMSGVLAWAFLVSERKFKPEHAQRDDWEQLLSHRPINEIPQKALGRDVTFIQEWFKHQDEDEYWRRADWVREAEKINVPALIVSGWYDDDGPGTSQAWAVQKENNLNRSRLILGPWKHSFNTTREIHNVPFGDNSIRYDLEILYLRWLDRFLKNIENGVEKESRTEYYMVGADRWEKAENWPPPEIKEKKLYLREGALLSTKPPGEEEPDTYIYDPQDPAPHLIDMSENELNVPEEYSEVEKRDDVISYSTPPLDEDTEIAGDLEAVLYLASDAPDTDWVVRLTDVHPDGSSIRLTDGILRARYRKSFARSEKLQPGRVEKYRINMGKIANRFSRGHRIRVSITSGAKNLAFPNLNTGGDPAREEESRVARQTIYHDPERSSYIILPVK